ncbi:hypothetical protein [Candidatus Venteria ishoeyi]|nr:hypothetical protein [Candidatus Venteria ishoeyi]
MMWERNGGPLAGDDVGGMVDDAGHGGWWGGGYWRAADGASLIRPTVLNT